MKACVIISISHWNAIYLWEMLFRWQKRVCTRRPTCLSKLYAQSKVTSSEEMKMNWIQDFQLPWEQSCQGHTRHRKIVTHNRRAHKIIRSNWNAPVRERGKEPIKSWPGDAHPSFRTLSQDTVIDSQQKDPRVQESNIHLHLYDLRYHFKI